MISKKAEREILMKLEQARKQKLANMRLRILVDSLNNSLNKIIERGNREITILNNKLTESDKMKIEIRSLNSEMEKLNIVLETYKKLYLTEKHKYDGVDKVKLKRVSFYKLERVGWIATAIFLTTMIILVANIK